MKSKAVEKGIISNKGILGISNIDSLIKKERKQTLKEVEKIIEEFARDSQRDEVNIYCYELIKKLKRLR